MDRRPDGDDEERTIDRVEPADAAPNDLDHAPPGAGDGFADDEPELDDLDADTGEDGPRRRRSSLSTIIVAGMLGLEEALGKKPKQEAPIVIASNSDPEDIDEHGIVIDLDEQRTVVSPPLPGRTTPAAPARKRVKRRRDG